MRLAEKATAFQAAVDKMTDFEVNNFTTYEDFKDLGVESARPIIDEYKRLFISPKGDYSQAVAAYMAARVLNPLVASTMDWEKMTDAIKDLMHFGFDKFRSGCGILDDMIEELPEYRAAVDSTDESFWSNVKGAGEYDETMRKKAEKNPGKYANCTWRDDRIEKARRVWEWWRVKAQKFNFFFTAARLVALVPISSTSVERVFSQVKFIIETVGVSVLEETLETRVMERVNRYD